MYTVAPALWCTLVTLLGRAVVTLAVYQLATTTLSFDIYSSCDENCYYDNVVLYCAHCATAALVRTLIPVFGGFSFLTVTHR
jgi:hypothetical protein